MYQPKFIKSDIVQKTWGYQEVLINGPDFCAKILHFNNAGNQSGFELHPIKRELFRVIRGGFRLGYKDELGRHRVQDMEVGDTVYLHNCVPHQLTANYAESEIFEVSTPEISGDRVCIGMGDSQRTELTKKMGQSDGMERERENLLRAEHGVYS